MTTRPQLGRPKPGDPVIVTVNSYRQTRHVDAKITKVGRTWIEMAETDNVRSQAKTWRMHMESQYETAGPNPRGDSFATPEQHAWDEQRAAADRYLRDQGITLDSGSPWRTPERWFRLAEILRAAEPDSEETR